MEPKDNKNNNNNNNGQVIRIRRTQKGRKEVKEQRLISFIDCSMLIDRLLVELKTEKRKEREIWLRGEIRHLRLIKIDLIKKACY